MLEQKLKAYKKIQRTQAKENRVSGLRTIEDRKENSPPKGSEQRSKRSLDPRRAETADERDSGGISKGSYDVAIQSSPWPSPLPPRSPVDAPSQRTGIKWIEGTNYDRSFCKFIPKRCHIFKRVLCLL